MTRHTSAAAMAALLMWAGPALAADPVKIGLTGPFTGGSSSMGVSMRDGAELAVKEINLAGGVLGRPLALVERDDEAKNEVGVQVAQELINKEGVVATLGFANTGVALAATRFYQEAEIPVIDNVATGSVVTSQFLPPDNEHNYIFRTAANDGIQSRMIAEEAVKRDGLQEARDPRRFHQLRPARPVKDLDQGAGRAEGEAGRRPRSSTSATPT